MGGSHCASHGGRGPLARKGPSVPDGSWSHLGPMQFALRYTTLSRRRLKPWERDPKNYYRVLVVTWRMAGFVP